MLISYLIKIPSEIGFKVYSPFLDFNLVKSMLTIETSRWLNRKWQSDFFEKNDSRESMLIKAEKSMTKLIFLGDFCLSRKSEIKVSRRLKSLISAADLISVNFEGPIISSDNVLASKAGVILGQDGGYQVL